DAAPRLVDERLPCGVGDLARMTERGVQVSRADEHAVDAIRGADRFDAVQRRLRLHLHEHADLLVRAARIILDASKTRRARRAGNAAHAVRWIARIGDGGARFLRAGDIRHQERLGAHVEHALDGHHAVPWPAYYR